MGISQEDRQGLDKSLQELKLSDVECDKFAKCFKDPEFIKLFEEYAKEVSDPKVRCTRMHCMHTVHAWCKQKER